MKEIKEVEPRAIFDHEKGTSTTSYRTKNYKDGVTVHNEEEALNCINPQGFYTVEEVYKHGKVTIIKVTNSGGHSFTKYYSIEELI